jgi:hypothetical protein
MWSWTSWPARAMASTCRQIASWSAVSAGKRRISARSRRMKPASTKNTRRAAWRAARRSRASVGSITDLATVPVSRPKKTS